MKKKLLSIILSAMIIGACAMSFVGCGKNKDNTATPDTSVATSDTVTSDEVAATVNNETVPVLSDTEQAIVDKGLKVDDKGNITDSKGNKVEVKEDGTVEVKTQSGETVRVKADDVKSANVSNQKAQGTVRKSNNNSNNSSSDKKTSNNSSSSKPSSSSSTADPHEGKTYHEAVYKTVNHPAETKVVNHPAETKEVKVVDKEAYTYEEPVYEKHGRTICNTCGADITENLISHGKWHTITNDENFSYHDEWVEIQVGTKTITVPEEYHYETQTVKEAWSETVVVKDAWTEKILVKEAGWY